MNAEVKTIFYIHPSGEPVEAREDWNAQKRRGSVTACRFKVNWRGVSYRVYSDHAHGKHIPHFINPRGVRIPIEGVIP